MITDINSYLLKELKESISVIRLCEILKISRSTFYRRIKETNFELTDIEQAIKDICHKTKFIYGYRKIHYLVNKQARCSINKVRQIMNKYGWSCRIKPKRFKRSINSFRLYENLVSSNWRVGEPRKLLTTDITYLPFGDSTQYLCSIIDVYNNEVITYKISNHPDAQLCVDTLKSINDLADECILHSNQGSTFSSEKYTDCGHKKGVIRSISQLGTPADNAIIESFHSSLKSETFYIESHKPSNFIVRKIVEKYIYNWNEFRILTKLGHLSSVEYRKLVV